MPCGAPALGNCAPFEADSGRTAHAVALVEVSAPLEARVAQSGGGATLRAVLAGLYARNATVGAGAGAALRGPALGGGG